MSPMCRSHCPSWPARSTPSPTPGSGSSAPCRSWRWWCASSSRSSRGRCCSARSAASSRCTAWGGRMPVAPGTRRRGRGRWRRSSSGHTRMSRLKVVAAAHWFTALAFIILFTTLVNAFFQLVQPDYRLPVIGHFPPFEWLVEVFAWAGLVGIVVLIAIRQRQHPRSAPGVGGRRSRFFGSSFWQAYYVEATIFFVTICILLLRGLEAAIVERLEPETSLALHFPLTGWMAGFWSDGLAAGSGDVGVRRRDGQDPHLVRLDDHHLAAADDGGRVAPLPRLPQHLVQARAVRAHGPRCGPAADGRRRPFDIDAMEEMEEGDTARGGSGRGLHVEGPARLLHVHGVRPLPVAVPGVEHRQAAVAQAAHDGAARPRRRQGARTSRPSPRTTATPRRPWRRSAAARRCRRTGPAAELDGAVSRGLGHRLVGDVARRGHRLRRGRPAHGIQPARPGRRHRPGRAVVVHDVRRVRRAVPGRHRARRPHRRHAALRRRSSSRRSRASSAGCSRTSRARATRGGWARGRGWTGPRTCRSRSRCSARTSRRRATSSGCSGSAAPAPTRTGRRRRPARWPSCSTPPG